MGPAVLTGRGQCVEPVDYIATDGGRRIGLLQQTERQRAGDHRLLHQRRMLAACQHLEPGSLIAGPHQNLTQIGAGMPHFLTTLANQQARILQAFVE